MLLFAILDFHVSITVEIVMLLELTFVVNDLVYKRPVKHLSCSTNGASAVVSIF